MRVSYLALALVLLSACDNPALESKGIDKTTTDLPDAATEYSKAINAQVAKQIAELPQDDLNLVKRGLIARADALRIEGPLKTAAWDLGEYQFLADGSPDDPPSTVNPSLWRQAQLNTLAGLFEVTEGIYQLRGFDLANMTLIAGDRGWIIVDPLTNAETARTALEFAFEHLPRRPITAVIFTHSHIDHFGGVFGVITPEQATRGDVDIIAPDGFIEEATSEMVLAGRIMGRRADFMYGRRLERSALGHVGSGLGKQPAVGTMAIARPTRVISQTGTALTVDGQNFLFQNVGGSEAPAEFTFFLPDKRAFCGAELVSRNLHNLYTLRGAKVRDALKWSGFIDESLRLFPETDVIFNSHHWPIWGRQEAKDYLKQQRDLYKYIHDQTLRLAGQGLTPDQIAESLTLPPSLRDQFHSRDYYGTVKHNARAVYQFYFGWYDGNPVHLDPLPATESAPRYVALLGGSDTVLNSARDAFDRGEYRWSAELLNHLVFANEDSEEARELLARNYEQLAYVAESGPWRDAYLTAAYELRHGSPAATTAVGDTRGLLRETPLPRIFELMAAMIDGPAAAELELLIGFHFSDLNTYVALNLENGVLHHQVDGDRTSAAVTVHLTHELLLDILMQEVNVRELVMTDDLQVEGSRLDLLRFLSLLRPHSSTFNIVRPNNVRSSD